MVCLLWSSLNDGKFKHLNNNYLLRCLGEYVCYWNRVIAFNAFNQLACIKSHSLHRLEDFKVIFSMMFTYFGENYNTTGNTLQDDLMQFFYIKPLHEG